MNKVISAIVIGACALSAACGYTKSDWHKALAANTQAAYQIFIRSYPKSEHADEARGRILALQDDQAWRAAQRANTVESFQGYLQRYGGGLHADDARFGITALRRAADWKSMQSELMPAALQAFLQKYPDGLESNEARQKLATMAYRVQMADSRSKSAAEHRRAELQRHFGDIVHSVVVLAPSAGENKYLLASVPMSESDARTACAALEREDQHCAVVQNAAAPRNIAAAVQDTTMAGQS
jgi:SPOR domain